MKMLHGEAWLKSRGKRIEDLILAAAIAPFAVPVGALGLLVVVAVDQENPFFAQKRVGKMGEAFTMFKIRTMPRHTQNVPSYGNHILPGVGPLGEKLRKYRIDEMPQLINVLGGNMSLICPRPLLSSELEIAREVLGEKEFTDWQRVRHLAPPGCVDPFNVHYFRNGLPTEHKEPDYDKYIPERVKVETEYVLETASLKTDVNILKEAVSIISGSMLSPKL